MDWTYALERKLDYELRFELCMHAVTEWLFAWLGFACPMICVGALRSTIRGLTDRGFLLASSLGHSQILYHSCGEKSGEGLGSKLRHRPEMVDSIST